MNRNDFSDPESRLGVYKTLSEVPDRYRLNTHSSAYEGRDVWSEYILEEFNQDEISEWRDYVLSKAGEDWKDHMSELGRHHALAKPEDIEKWCKRRLETASLRTVYEHYWVQIEQLYSWLAYHDQHPHVYNPALMAAANFPASRDVWRLKITRGRIQSNVKR